MEIVPVHYTYWDEGAEELVVSDEVVGYKVVSETGALLGAGSTREEALDAARHALVMPEPA